jgi:hypothetical protein
VARYNRLHRERIQHREDLRCQAVIDIQNLTERFFGQDDRQFGQRRENQDRRFEEAPLFARQSSEGRLERLNTGPRLTAPFGSWVTTFH